MILDSWAHTWGIPAAAMLDLKARLGHSGEFYTQHPRRPEEGASEGHVQTRVQIEGAQKDIYLWRNNVGVLIDIEGRPVRYGLANESKQENAVLKSSDLIGIRKVFIEPYMIGRTIGQFVAREVKHGEWTYTGDAHETAQQAFGNLVLAHGGDFAFAAGVGTL